MNNRITTRQLGSGAQILQRSRIKCTKNLLFIRTTRRLWWWTFLVWNRAHTFCEYPHCPAECSPEGSVQPHFVVSKRTYWFCFIRWHMQSFYTWLLFMFPLEKLFLCCTLYLPCFLRCLQHMQQAMMRMMKVKTNVSITTPNVTMSPNCIRNFLRLTRKSPGDSSGRPSGSDVVIRSSGKTGAVVPRWSPPKVVETFRPFMSVPFIAGGIVHPETSENVETTSWVAFRCVRVMVGLSWKKPFVIWYHNSLAHMVTKIACATPNLYQNFIGRPTHCNPPPKKKKKEEKTIVFLSVAGVTRLSRLLGYLMGQKSFGRHEKKWLRDHFDVAKKWPEWATGSSLNYDKAHGPVFQKTIASATSCGTVRFRNRTRDQGLTSPRHRTVALAIVLTTHTTPANRPRLHACQKPLFLRALQNQTEQGGHGLLARRVPQVPPQDQPWRR